MPVQMRAVLLSLSAKLLAISVMLACAACSPNSEVSPPATQSIATPVTTDNASNVAIVPRAENTESTDNAESDEAAVCRMMAESMITIGWDAVNDANARPERRAERRVLVEDWEARLEEGDDPCDVYEAIYLASTTF